MRTTGDPDARPQRAPRHRVQKARKAVVASAIGLLGLAVASQDAGPGFADDIRTAADDRDVDPAQELAATPQGPFIGPTLGATGALPVDAQAPVVAPGATLALPAAAGVGPTAATGSLQIPAAALAGYQRAAQNSAASRPDCHVTWPLLASIGRIESGHASGGRLDASGSTLGRILGPRLDGAPGVAAIGDSDGGALDGDTVWDRAVGPMQFIPTTWRAYRADGNGDGVADPHNIYDAATASANYLCAGGGNMFDPDDLVAAVFRYNHSDSYVRTVVSWAQAYATGVRPSESLPGSVPAPTDALGTPALPTAETLPPGVTGDVLALLPLAVGGAAALPTPTPLAPAVSPTATPLPVATPVVPSPTPVPSATASPTPTPSPSPSPTATPTPTRSPSPSPSASPSPSPTPSPSPSPSPSTPATTSAPAPEVSPATGQTAPPAAP